jgi:predicted protein tyrosine phosphatase
LRIYVSSLAEMARHVRERRPGWLVSLVQPAYQPPRPPEIAEARHLRVAVDDVSEPVEGTVLPGEAHVRELVAFLRSWPADEALLIHCFAGISRSTAAALIALTLHRDEMDAARVLRERAPHAIPNARIVALADRALGRGGRLIAAREAMGGPTLALAEAPLVDLPLR